MQVLNVRNVHDALIRGVDLLETENFKERTRNGVVYRAKTPVTTVYEKPKERVLFWEERDANPFFHFMEGLWMLTGRNDLDFVKGYARNMKNYSDDGETLWGAYGWRWRSYFGKDQLKIIIDRLKAEPEDRRCVLQMWDAKEDLNRDGKDVPCNTSIYFSEDHTGRLEMTVSNRSNDIIWGAYGANAVHMSMLQEYVAHAIGRPVGRYYQISNNYHAYIDIYEKLLKKLNDRDALDFYSIKYPMVGNPYEKHKVSPYSMFNDTNIREWERDLEIFMERKPFKDCKFYDKFFTEVAAPMQDAFRLHKMGETEEAMVEISRCKATDWRRACYEWLERRM